MEKVHIECNTVQETLVIPLYARVLCTKAYDQLIQKIRSILDTLAMAAYYDLFGTLWVHIF